MKKKRTIRKKNKKKEIQEIQEIIEENDSIKTEDMDNVWDYLKIDEQKELNFDLNTI